MANHSKSALMAADISRPDRHSSGIPAGGVIGDGGFSEIETFFHLSDPGSQRRAPVKKVSVSNERNDISHVAACLPESVKADIFGTEAPDKVHSTAIPGFTIGRVIGEGGFSQVRVGAHHLSAAKVAIKVVDKSKIEEEGEEKRIRREIRAMKHVNGHSRVVRLYMTKETDQFIYIVMEFAAGGTLLDFIKKRTNLKKTEAARIMSQLVSGLDFLHCSGVIHRDFKLENIMLDCNNNVKIIDLGFCAFDRPGKHLFNVFCGSPSYVSPEIASRTPYEGPPVDVWALGVCFYAMLTGNLPFYNSRGKDDIDIKIMAGNYKTDFMKKSLVEGLLAVDPSKRMTLDKVLSHPWMKCYLPMDTAEEPDMVLDSVAMSTLITAGYEREQISEALMREDVTEVTAAYYILALQSEFARLQS